ncbi:RRM_6 domain-containing protein [Cephalotus follicularis]|uniref:RRM_6 domain-containing protein n=1 Tax=Cephalotus follicularis TaxID=3775 RepID=A0A1Q3BQC3_CEPFO|nr:RRM_6 domain-containing protein [Cephalotus follicularis]
MELKVSSIKPGSLSPSDCASEPEEKEVSDDDDDDRNHKHRRRETRSQSLERETSEPVFTRAYRKRNKPIENGYSFRENESQASETWKSYNVSPLEKEFTAKFEKRRPVLTSLPRTPLDLNQRFRGNQPFTGDTGSGRGRGREPGWNRDYRFNAVDIASQMVQQGSFAPKLFAGRGLPNISNAQSAAWSTFGLVPGMPNGGLDTLHPIGLQGIRPPLSSSLNIGIPRQRCRDFEERGFCLRGDMCPMEHGINRIVIEDVQSLSQFNLPVSIASAQLVGIPAGPGPLSSIDASSNTIMNSKGAHIRSSKPGTEDGFGGAYSSSASAGGADLYDPDQPLWNNSCPETSTALLALSSPRIDETESLLNVDPSDRHLAKLPESADNEGPSRSSGTAIGTQGTSLSVWGRVGGSRSNIKEKIDLTVGSSDYLEHETREDREALANVQGTSRQRKRVIAEDAGPKAMDSSPGTQNSMRLTRKTSQKALRTLFVSGIPQISNKREALVSHFRKFGEVIDIYIPLNSERAFIQFSKREEAEAALKAPDAVMGNRFIKLWWANRDSIPDNVISNASSVSVAPSGTGVAAASVPFHPSVANRGKDNLQSSALKGSFVSASDVSTDHPKPVISNVPKVPPSQKKLENLEQLKEELRIKQEMLDQKRNDFRRQLDKLAKQATGVKGEVVAEQAAKRLKVGVAADVAKAAATSSFDPGLATASLITEMMADKNKSTEKVVFHSPKTSISMELEESKSSKQPIRPLASAGASFSTNRYKLDNRPTAFRVASPLPAAFASVAALQEHFSSYGDLSTIDLEEMEVCNSGDGSERMKNCSARINFKARHSAERAFVNGKCWQGHNLQFTWLTPSNYGNDHGGRENSPFDSKGHADAVIHTAENLACDASENGKPESSERKSGNGHMELQEVSKPIPTIMSGGEESPKGNGC